MCRDPQQQFSQENGDPDTPSLKRPRSNATEPISPPEGTATNCSITSTVSEVELRPKKGCRPRMKAFDCIVHGRIELHHTLVKIIDTPQYQRLRRCKQLGHASLVFQNATHSRFEHSLGVAFKAGKLCKRIMEHQPDLNVTAKDKLCVEIAALVHDLGHG
jgi:hypothetical protein